MMKIYCISTLLLLNFLSCKGAADFDVERVRSPYVENRDLGPLMSQRPSMQSETFSNFPYHRSTGPRRSYSSSYGYQQGASCPTCAQNSLGSSHSSSSYYSSYGSAPSSSNYYDNNFRSNQYYSPPQTFSSKQEVKEEKEFVNGQQVYDLHHEKRYKDGQMVYNQKKEKTPQDFGVTSNAYDSYDSYKNPALAYGSSGSSSSYRYNQETESNPVKFASLPHTSGSNSQRQIYSSGTNYGNINTYPIPEDDQFDRDFQSEVERLREEMRKKTMNYHQNSHVHSPVAGNSHRTEYRTQTKYINGKPIYTKKETKKYMNGKLVQDETHENDHDNKNFQNRDLYPVQPGYDRFHSQHSADSYESRVHNSNIPPYQVSPGNNQYDSHMTQTNSQYSSSNSQSPTSSVNPASSYPDSSYRPSVHNTVSSTYYEKKHNTETYPTDTSNNRYITNYDQKTNPNFGSYDYSFNKDDQTPDSSDQRPYSSTTYSRISEETNQSENRPVGTYNSPSRSSPREDQIHESSHHTTTYNRDVYGSNTYDNYPDRNKSPETEPTYLYNTISSDSQTSHYRPNIQENEGSSTDSRYSSLSTYNRDDDDDSEEDLPEDERPMYAASHRQPIDERPYASDVTPEEITNDEEEAQIEKDKGRYDISPYDGLPHSKVDADENEPQEPTTTPSSHPKYNPNRRPLYENTHTYEESRTSDHSVAHERPIPRPDSSYPQRNEYSTYNSSISSIYDANRPSYANTQTYEESKSTRDHSVNQFNRQRPISSLDSHYPGQHGYSAYNSSSYEHQISNILPSRWVETRTTWKYVNGLLVSETQYHKYYENGVMIHENVTERTRDQMKADGVDVVNLDLTPSELALYGTPSTARSHSQKHELHQMKRFKNGQPIYELNHERLFQDGDLVHENHTEKHAEDFKEDYPGNHQLLQSQRLNQHSVTHPGTITTSGLREMEGFSVIPKTYVRRHEIRQEQEFVDGQKVYDLHHEKEYKDGHLIKENKTELGPDDLGVKGAPHRDALKEILAGRSQYAMSEKALNQQKQSAHNTLRTSCLTCNPDSSGAVGSYLDHQSNVHSSNIQSLGHQVVPSGQNVGQESSYRKEFEVEELYENGKLVKGKEERKHWKDGQLVDQDSNTYFHGPSRVDIDRYERPPLVSTSYRSRNRSKCSSNPCKNGGRCRTSVSGEICLCRFGFKGNRCEEAYCPNRYCRHGGTCSIIAGEHECACPEGYKGQRCATREITVSLGASGIH